MDFLQAHIPQNLPSPRPMQRHLVSSSNISRVTVPETTAIEARNASVRG